MTFRELLVSDVRVRVLDAVGHVVLAVVLPGSWWMQYLPDCLLPVIFGVSLYTNKLLSKRNPVLRVHRFLHSAWVVLALVLLARYRPVVAYIALHFTWHLILDAFTHERWKTL